MYFEEPSIQDSLIHMIRRMTSNPTLRDDLLQEALIHFWLTESRRPGQTKSWYLQCCKFHLQHYLASGRSLDSNKRRAGQASVDSWADDQDDLFEQLDSGHSVVTLVSTREIISLLSQQLLPHEKAVLNCLADGLGPREIGRRLNISHTMAIKHRCKIAQLLTRLESPRPRPRSAMQVSNRNGSSMASESRVSFASSRR
jgi:DNA-directed RNA polymerase specialized sigma24 family protein